MKNYFKQIVAASVLAYALFFASRPITDPDFWFHLKTGEYITQKGVIPKTDLFSFTNFGKPWVAHEWLSGVIFYAIYSAIGLNGLVLVFAVVTVLAFWIAFRYAAVHPFIKGFAFLLSVWTVVPTIGVRPRVFTLLLASIYLTLLSAYSRLGKGRAVWWLVPLMMVWVNLHAGFLIGIVLIVLTIVGMLLDSWASGENIRSLYPRLVTLVAVLLGCLLAAIVNPHGPRIYLFPFEIFFSQVQQQLVTDWFSPDFHDPTFFPLGLLILLTTAALALSSRRARPSELLLLLTTLYATLKSSRHLAIFALVAGPLVADYLQTWLASTSYRQAFAQPPSLKSTGQTVLLTSVLLLPLAASVPKLRTTVYAPPRQEIVSVPVAAVEYLKEKQIEGNTFTDPNIWGDYLIWALPENPVYIDGRIDMYGDQFVKEYLDLIWGITDWRGLFGRYSVRVAIVRPKSPLNRQLKESTDWQQVFEDSMAVVFTKVDRPK
jgi:hypothetical protein